MKTNKKKENEFQANLKKKIEERIPGVIILKNDPGLKRGIPDLTILGNGTYAVLECKREEDAARRANQEYYIDIFNNWAYGSFVQPENEEQVLNELEQHFKR